MRQQEQERKRAERERQLQAEATADAMVQRMREYSPNPPHSRPIYADLSPEGKQFFTKLARQMVEREGASVPYVIGGRPVTFKPRILPGLGERDRSTQVMEAMHGLVREGIEMLAQRDRAADERDRRADERERRADRRARLMVRLTIATVVLGALGWLDELAGLLG